MLLKLATLPVGQRAAAVHHQQRIERAPQARLSH